MNQKDYKEIAGIIKKEVKDDDLSTELLRVNIVKGLADYFEREAWKEAGIKASKTTGMIDADFMNFNKQQFLKDCGVEK